jgi:hypothetical protein
VSECKTDFVIVLSTGQLIKFDMAVNALKEAGIAHQVRAETATGLKRAVSVTPSPGPGQFFTVLVPACDEEKAKLALSELPFEATTNPGSWDFGPRPMVKRWSLLVVIGLVMCLVVMGIIEVVRFMLG